jgi:competence protein ComEC
VPPVAQFAIAYAAGLWVGRVAFLPAGGLAAAAGLLLARHAPWRAVLAAALLAGTLRSGLARRSELTGCAATWTPGRHAALVRVGDAAATQGVARAVVLHAAEGCGGALLLRLTAAVPSGATLLVVGQYRAPGALHVVRQRLLRRARSPRFVLRDAISARIAQLYGARAPLVDALVTGRRGAIDPAVRADFAAAGLAHLLAISGLHVGIVAAWLALAARLLGLGRRTAPATAVVTWLYVAFLGFPAPATRAAAFISVQALARTRQRHPPGAALLALGALAVLALDQSAGQAAGAWLSFAAVWGTGAALDVLPPGRRRGPWPLLAASVGATVATAPITALTVGAVAPIGVLANLLAVPAAGVAVPGVFASLIGGGPFAAGAGLVLAGIERVAAVAASVPCGHLQGEPGVRLAAPWMMVLAAAVWWHRRRPTWGVIARRSAALAAAVAWLGVAAAAWPVGGYAGLTLYVLDVGQGDAIAIRSPHGHWMLVDGGPRSPSGDAGRRVVVPFLRRHGARALDMVVASHADADHLGGIPATLAALPVGTVLEPGQPVGTALYLEFLATVDQVGAVWRPARAGDLVDLDGVRVAVLHPSAAWRALEVRTNENSVVLRVTYGAFDALLTGDIGFPAESALAGRVGRVELLKVGHHGSAGSSGSAWLDAVAPRVAVISVGPNGFGHPSPAALARLAAHRVTVYRTDRGGMVTIRSDGRYFSVDQQPANAPLERLLCPILDWLRSRVSSSSSSGCSPRPRGSSPTSYTTWPSPPRSSPATCGAPGSPRCSGGRAR